MSHQQHAQSGLVLPRIIARGARELYGITLYETKRATIESYLILATSSEAARRAALEDNATRTHRSVEEVEHACESEMVFLTENGRIEWTIVHLMQWTCTGTNHQRAASESQKHLPDSEQEAESRRFSP